MSRRATVRRTVSGRWQVTRWDVSNEGDAGICWRFLGMFAPKFGTWREAYDYADRWTRGPDRHQCDYGLASR